MITMPVGPCVVLVRAHVALSHTPILRALQGGGCQGLLLELGIIEASRVYRGMQRLDLLMGMLHGFNAIAVAMVHKPG